MAHLISTFAVASPRAAEEHTGADSIAIVLLTIVVSWILASSTISYPSAERDMDPSVAGVGVCFILLTLPT